MPTTTPGTFDAPNVLASASSIAARFARGNGSDVLTSAARAVAVTASSAIIRDNAKARGLANQSAAYHLFDAILNMRRQRLLRGSPISRKSTFQKRAVLGRRGLAP